MNARDKLATGRLMACNKMRYFRSYIMALVPKETAGLGTFGVTDDGILLWDPKMAEQWSVEEIAAVLIHEVCHLLQKHSTRRDKLASRMGDKFSAEKWNNAADCEINDDLHDAKLKLPSFKTEDGKPAGEPYIPQKMKLPTGLTAEEYMNLLPDPPKGKGGKPHVGCGWCGSGAGRPLPNEQPSKGNSKGRSKAEMERAARGVAEAIREAAARGQGNVPAGWARWAEEMMKPPKVRWQDKLSRVTRGSLAYRPGAHDYHYTKPSRRQAGLGYGPGVPILPAMRAPQPKVAVVQDTSGSMGTAELSVGLPEVAAILKSVGGQVDFCACDAAVHVLQPVKHWRELLGLMKGGGGTDFRPAFKALEEKREKPSLIVFITDGQGTFPSHAPNGIKVVWLLCGAHIGENAVPFGEAVVLDDARPDA